MTCVLLIGIKPEAVDVSDLDQPPGTTSEKIAAGVDATLLDMKERGWEGALCSILPDDSAEATIAASLAECWDCFVIGGGIRVPSRSLPLSSGSLTPSAAALLVRRSRSTPLQTIQPTQRRDGWTRNNQHPAVY